MRGGGASVKKRGIRKVVHAELIMRSASRRKDGADSID